LLKVNIPDNYLIICLKTNEVFSGKVCDDNLTLVGKCRDLKEAISLAMEFEKFLWEMGSLLQYGTHFYENLKGFNVFREVE